MPKPGPNRQHSVEEYLRAVRNVYGPAAGTSEVADQLGVARQTADDNLRELHDQGYVNTKKVGRARVWWVSNEGERELYDVD